MPPFWWNVKQVTFLQYAVHEFKTFHPRELLYINVVKIYLQTLFAQQSHEDQYLSIKSSCRKEIIEHVALGLEGH
jgi:hypothetical protein